MDLAALKFHALLTPTLMELNVFVLTLKIIVFHGNTITELSVCISKTLVQKEQDGTAQLLPALQLENVLKDSIEMLQTVSLSLKDVFLQLPGMERNALVGTAVLIKPTDLEATASPSINVKMVKFGAQISFNVFALKTLDGMAMNV